MKSLMCDFLYDINQWFHNVFGEAGITVLICVFSVMAIMMLWNIINAAIGGAGKKKIVIKWGQILLLAIVLLIDLWLIII